MIPLLKTLLFTALVPCSVALWIPWGWLRVPRPLEPAQYLGFPLIAAGALLYAWCAGLFALVGKGTPAPVDPPTEFVAGGPYRWSRNPMYIGVEAVLAGESLLCRSTTLAAYLAGFAALAHLFVVFYEERTLRRRFGASYERYCREVNRWLPRRPRAQAAPG
jgi:protein-S-isoprenylcysteine O-methyltransferase Ste14